LEEIPVEEVLKSIKYPTRITCLPSSRVMLIGTRNCAIVFDPESDEE